MREIKLRAYHKKWKKMLLVKSINWIHGGGVHLGDFGSKEVYQLEPMKDVVLMQSTGLKDKNGKGIWEGDVFQFGTVKEWQDGEGERGTVEWHEKLARFGLGFYSLYGGEGYTGKNQHLVDFIKGFKIIGNIHENPELLGE